jgi:hypothetical protein
MQELTRLSRYKEMVSNKKKKHEESFFNIASSSKNKRIGIDLI